MSSLSYSILFIKKNMKQVYGNGQYFRCIVKIVTTYQAMKNNEDYVWKVFCS